MKIDVKRTKESQRIADRLVRHINKYHEMPETWNNKLDNQLRKWYLNAEDVFPKRPYFSPSSANACPLSLFVKGKGAKRDTEKKQPHQTRWQRIGTAIGDLIQRDLLDAENYSDEFVFDRTEKGEPAFEEFIKTNKLVRVPETYGDGYVEYYLYGNPDGIMVFTDPETKEKVRVGLEIKSKQTTNARLSDYSMREAEEDHINQVVAYSYMYDVDYYVILYINASKKTWNMTDEETRKYPDIKAFGYHITEIERYQLLSELGRIQEMIEKNMRPRLDPYKWSFNGYKTACIKTLDKEDIDELLTQRSIMLKSSLPNYKKENLVTSVDDIVERWEKLNDDE